MSANSDPPTIEQRRNALTTAIEAEAATREEQDAAFHATLEAEAKARAEFEALSQLRGKAIDARLHSQAMHINLLAHETHAMGIKIDRIADSLDTLKHIVTDLVQLATSHERGSQLAIRLRAG